MNSLDTAQMLFDSVMPDYKKVPELMEEISSEWNDLEGTLKEVLEKITELHFRFERIHPFEDGNGRTGRMILNRQLINIGLLPIALDKISKYRCCFKVYERMMFIFFMKYLHTVERPLSFFGPAGAWDVIRM